MGSLASLMKEILICLEGGDREDMKGQKKDKLLAVGDIIFSALET